MNGTARAIALLLALSWGFFGCEDNGHPLRPSPDAERYPNTTILFGVNHYHTQPYGPMVSDTIRFDDGEPDTLPYNSLLTLYYYGCADERDKAGYIDPHVEMRYQFHFWRQGVSISGNHASTYMTPWYPLQEAEDTYCHSNLDSVTMRVGTYDYRFMVRSFDDEYNSDQTPDTVRFVGNFPPAIDDLQIGYDAEPKLPEVAFTPISGDTFYAGLGKIYQSRPDTASPCDVEFDTQEMMFTYYYKIILTGSGHDDDRDPLWSAIKGWRYTIQGPEDHYFQDEDEWVYDNPNNAYYQEIPFQIRVPYDTESGGPDYSIIDDPPGFLGAQVLTVGAADIGEYNDFFEGIRGVSPVFDPEDPCTQILPGKWITVQRRPARYARHDAYVRHFYIKLVY